MIFAWQGKTHIITNYQVVTDSGSGTQFGIISFTDKYNISDTYAGAGLAARASSAAGNNITLQAGLQSAETGNITVNISTCRATSHDFLDIGTGGYNTSNYPDRIFGGPKIAAVTDEESLDSEGFASKAQVQERSRGRCFFASTDQDGFFRVGRFFTVDQGTGRITFNAALVLTNIDGIGFKRGVRVNEFSADSTFTNATADAVPVETAVEGYIDRRLGMDRNGTVLSGAEIIPQTTGGFLALSGAVPMAGDLRMGGQQINDLATPTSGSDAATKAYVDAGDEAYDTLAELEDTDITAPVDGAFLVYDNSASNWIDTAFDTNVANSDFSVTLDGTSGLLEGQITAGAIVNADVNASAAIAQSKLSLSDATAAATAGAAVKGIASFNDADFGTSSGYVSIKALGVSNAQLAGSITNAKLSNSSITFGDGSSTVATALGNAVTIQGTANEVSVSIADSTPVAGSPTFTVGLPNKIAVDVDGDIYNGTTLIVDVSEAEFEGNANSADQVKTINSNTNATHYLTFVDSANAAATNEIIKTDAGITYNPSTNLLTVDGAINADGNITLEATHTVTAPGGYRGAGNGAGTDNGSTIGTSSDRFNTIYAQTFNGTATEALYADLAENYVGDVAYEPGTVLVFGGEAEVTTTNTKSDHRIAGVVTTNPAHLMNSALEGETVVGVALQGRVPCKVLGKVEKGDMLVTAAKEGYAIVNNTPGVGQVLGKAVGTKEDDGYGIVEVVVGRV